MPPKKKDEVKTRLVLGRFGTNLRMGIVGMPNVGKSTFFNVLTKSSAPAENFPFCTINPNESRVPVPDDRFDWLVKHYEPASIVPAYLNITDIAGLVKGAHAGEGLGNEFLANIKACDGIFHMIRVFSSDTIVHVEGEVDPVRDMETIQEELILKDIAVAEKALFDIEKKAMRSKDPVLKFEADTISKVKDNLVEKRLAIRFCDWNEKEIEILNKHLFLTAKPVIYLINMSEHDYLRKRNKWLAPIKQWLDEHDPGVVAITFSAEHEAKLADEADNGTNEISGNGSGANSALSKIIVSGYKVLNLIYFFTAGKDEVKCWTIQNGTRAPQAAGKIHTDFEKGFIMAEVMKFSDLKELETEAAVKSAGKYRSQGKAYLVEDGDVIFFKFNAGAGLTQSKK